MPGFRVRDNNIMIYCSRLKVIVATVYILSCMVCVILSHIVIIENSDLEQ